MKRWVARLAALTIGIAASSLAAAGSARAQGTGCEAGSRLLRVDIVSTPTGPARQPICIRSIRVRLWIKAFIPSEHPTVPGYILTTAAGTTAIPGPERDRVGIGPCFLTDQRLFDPDPAASARITIAMDVIVEEGRVARIIPRARGRFVRAGPTHKVNCRSGAAIGTGHADERGIAISFDDRGVDMRGGIGNPFWPLPLIDIDLRLALDVARARFLLSGAISPFPAFEGYYSVDGGPTQALFQLPPEPGSSTIHLIDLAGGFRSVSASLPLPTD